MVQTPEPNWNLWAYQPQSLVPVTEPIYTSGSSSVKWGNDRGTLVGTELATTCKPLKGEHLPQSNLLLLYTNHHKLSGLTLNNTDLFLYSLGGQKYKVSSTGVGGWLLLEAPGSGGCSLLDS